MTDIFNVILTVIVSIFILSIIWMVGVYIVGGNIYPIVMKMNPITNTSQGITNTTYQRISNHLYTSMTWSFYIILATPFIFLIIYLLYRREQTTIQNPTPNGW